MLSFQHVIKIKWLMRDFSFFFCTKSLKFNVYITYTWHLSSDWPHAKCSVATYGQRLLYWRARVWCFHRVSLLMVWLPLRVGGRKRSWEMSAHLEKMKCQFVKRKMLTRSSGKYNFTSELFICTGQMLLHSRADFVLMEKKKIPNDLMLVIS